MHYSRIQNVTPADSKGIDQSDLWGRVAALGRESLVRSKQRPLLPHVSGRVDLPFRRPGVWVV